MKNWKINSLLLLFTLGATAVGFSQEAANEKAAVAPMEWGWLPIALITTAVILLITILVVAGVLNTLSKSVISNKSKLLPILIIGFSLLSTAVFANEPTTAVAPPSQLGNIMLYSILGIVVLVEIMVLIYLLKNVKILLKILAPQGEEVVAGEDIFNVDSLWNKIMGLKPMEQEDDLRMKDHIYDGTIQELDNRMPPWLRFMFNATIVFAVVYIYLYHYTTWGPDPKREYDTAMAEASVKKAAFLDRQANNIDENKVTALTDAASIQSGGTIYKTNCAACHGDKGQGGVGPNLTDEYWLHGGAVKDIYKTIAYGVEAKGMRSWKNDIMPADIQKVASFIKTLKGTNPPGAKAPQGDVFKEEAAPTTAAPETTTPAAPAPTK